VETVADEVIMKYIENQDMEKDAEDSKYQISIFSRSLNEDEATDLQG